MILPRRCLQRFEIKTNQLTLTLSQMHPSEQHHSAIISRIKSKVGERGEQNKNAIYPMN